jgi:hypothetical protein
MNSEYFQHELGVCKAEAQALEDYCFHQFRLVYLWAPLWLDEDWDGVVAVVKSFARAKVQPGTGGIHGQR